MQSRFTEKREFRTWLLLNGLSQSTANAYASLVVHAMFRVDDYPADSGLFHAYVENYAASTRTNRDAARRWYARWLERHDDTDVIQLNALGTAQRKRELVPVAFRAWLLSQAGLAPATVAAYVSTMRRGLTASLAASGRLDDVEAAQAALARQGAYARARWDIVLTHYAVWRREQGEDCTAPVLTVIDVPDDLAYAVWWLTEKGGVPVSTLRVMAGEDLVRDENVGGWQLRDPDRDVGYVGRVLGEYQQRAIIEALQGWASEQILLPTTRKGTSRMARAQLRAIVRQGAAVAQSPHASGSVGSESSSAAASADKPLEAVALPALPTLPTLPRE